MTENETINHIILMCHRCVGWHGGKCHEAGYCFEARQIAIQALKKIQQYRAIGTVEQLEWCKDASHWKELFKEKLEKYEAIGTIEEFKALKEKNVAKKPAHDGCYDEKGVLHIWNGINGVPYDLCPNCAINLCTDGWFGRDKSKIKYCENCGQKLDWQ